MMILVMIKIKMMLLIMIVIIIIIIIIMIIIIVIMIIMITTTMNKDINESCFELFLAFVVGWRYLSGWPAAECDPGSLSG